MLRRLAVATAMAAASCASTFYVEPFDARPAKPGAGEVVLVRDSLVIFDASGSIDREVDFPQEKAVLESFVDGMPPGTYRSYVVVLGGRQNDHLRLKSFDRWKHRAHASNVSWTGRETPLAAVLREYTDILAEREGRAALVIFSDGVPTRYGKVIGPDETLAAARQLRGRRENEICLHTIQVGNDPSGELLLRQLGELTACGSSRRLDDLKSPEALQAFQQAVYNGPPPSPKARRARAITDLDQDGVDDRFDRCARTPFGAIVDERGCWVIEDYVFETGSATILPERRDTLERVTDVLEANPDLRIRLDGHTDDTGTPEFNFDLAERRASSVRTYLVERGIDAERLEVRGFGQTRPVASNDTPEGRRKNRRVDLSVIDR